MTFGVLVKIAGYLWFFEPLEKMNRSLLPPSFFFFVCFLFGFCFVFLFFFVFFFLLLLLRLVLLDLLC